MCGLRGVSARNTRAWHNTARGVGVGGLGSGGGGGDGGIHSGLNGVGVSLFSPMGPMAPMTTTQQQHPVGGGVGGGMNSPQRLDADEDSLMVNLSFLDMGGGLGFESEGVGFLGAGRLTAGLTAGLTTGLTAGLTSDLTAGGGITAMDLSENVGGVVSWGSVGGSVGSSGLGSAWGGPSVSTSQKSLAPGTSTTTTT